MTSQLPLLAIPEPAQPEGIDLRCCDVAEVLALPLAAEARLVHADPPWGEYLQRPGVAAPDLAYPLLSWDDIDAHLSTAADVVRDARLALWWVWPLGMERIAKGERVLPGVGWRWVTGGAWHKPGRVGVGYHWRGASEPVAVGVVGSPPSTEALVLNSHAEAPAQHSAKPLDWLRAWVRAWTSPGDLVLDLYAGTAPMARACLAEGRRYLGAEIDPERYRVAVDLLAMRRGL